MLEKVKEVVKRFSFDQNVLVCAVYRVDGTPVETMIKDKEYIHILQWLEDQMKVLLRFISDGSLRSVDFKTKDYIIFLFPISKSLAMAIVSTSEASVYKLKIDAESLKEILNV
ncbi:MAG: hypothetical protein RMH75_03935 [Archaeoglobaceae archaeon]|nr:hypothetical protein [Archaeoglobaceae archaeon]